MRIGTGVVLVAAAVAVSLAITFFALMMTPRDPLAPFQSSEASGDFSRQRVTGVAKIPRLWQLVASGESYSCGREPVHQTVLRCATRTFAVQFPGIMLGWSIGCGLGVFLGANEGRSWSSIAHVILYLAILVPYPILIASARMLLLDTGLFNIGLNQHGFGAYVPAVLSITFVLIPVTALHQAAVATVAWSSDEVMFARAIGVPLAACLRIVLNQSAAYWRTQIALLLAATVQGSVMLEHVFHINGLGAVTFEATSRGDACLLLLIVSITSVLTALGLVWAGSRSSVSGH